MFGLQSKVLGIVGIGTALALLGCFAWGKVGWSRADTWHERYEVSVGVNGRLLNATRIATGQPKLKLPEADDAIRQLGASRDAWKETVDLQNVRIDELGIETARLKALNGELLARAKEAIAKRDRAISRLRNDALDPGERSNCAAQIIEAEQALDEVYREGL